MIDWRTHECSPRDCECAVMHEWEWRRLVGGGGGGRVQRFRDAQALQRFKEGNVPKGQRLR